MASVLLDTHAWAWSLADDARLSQAARRAMALAEAVYVSPISFFEIGQKIRKGQWPQMAPYAEKLVDVLAEQGGLVAPLTPAICLRASLMEWAHRDPLDRILAATVELCGDLLVSKDEAFDRSGIASLRRVW